MTNERIGPVLRAFFGEYLLGQRRLSPNTQLSYRDAIKMFLAFVAGELHRPVTALNMTDLTTGRVLQFLDELESVRGVKVVTRNQRLAALHTFFRYAAFCNPSWIDIAQQVLAIPYKRTDETTLPYLTRDVLANLLEQPNRTTPAGRRDYAMLALLYNTGCRIQEALNLRVADVFLEHPASVRLMCKGRKEHHCPLWAQTAALLKVYIEERRVAGQPDAVIFINRHGRPLTRFGARYLLRKYQELMEAERLPCNLHPHLMRHTAAVHMLQAGMDLNSVRNILGHKSINTTCIYTEIDLEMKRTVLEKAGLADSVDAATAAALPDEVLTWLESL